MLKYPAGVEDGERPVCIRSCPSNPHVIGSSWRVQAGYRVRATAFIPLLSKFQVHKFHRTVSGMEMRNFRPTQLIRTHGSEV